MCKNFCVQWEEGEVGRTVEPSSDSRRQAEILTDVSQKSDLLPSQALREREDARWIRPRTIYGRDGDDDDDNDDDVAARRTNLVAVLDNHYLALPIHARHRVLSRVLTRQIRFFTIAYSLHHVYDETAIAKDPI